MQRVLATILACIVLLAGWQAYSLRNTKVALQTTILKVQQTQGLLDTEKKTTDALRRAASASEEALAVRDKRIETLALQRNQYREALDEILRDPAVKPWADSVVPDAVLDSLRKRSRTSPH